MAELTTAAPDDPFRAAQQGLVRPFTPGHFSDLSVDEGPSFGQSVFAAAKRESITAAGIEAHRRATADFESDPEFSMASYLDENQDDLSDVMGPLLQHEAVQQSRIRSKAHADWLANTLRQEQDMVNKATANGMLAYGIGGLAGIFLDPGSWVAGGPFTKVYQAARAVGNVSRLGRSLRVAGVFGGAEALREGILQQGQQLRTTEESLMAIGLGTTIGSAFGAVGKTGLPSSGAGALKRKGPQVAHDLPRTEDELAEHPLNPNVEDPGVAMPDGSPEMQKNYLDQARSAGAAEVELDEALPGTSFGGLDKVTPIGRAFRRSRRFIQKYRDRLGEDATEGQRTAVQAADVAQQRAFSLMTRLVDVQALTKLQEAGEITDTPVEIVAKHLESDFIAYGERMNEIYEQIPGAAKTIAADRPNMGKQVVEALKTMRARVSMDKFNREVRRYRLLRDEEGNAQDYMPDSSIPFENAAERAAFTKKVQEAATVADEYFDMWGKRMVETGIIEEADLVDNYFPQVYNRAEIQDDPETFKRYVKELLIRRPPDDWVEENYGVGSFSELQKRSADEASEAADEWRASNREEAAQEAENALQKALDEIEVLEVAEKQARKMATRNKRTKLRRMVSRAREEGRAKAQEAAEIRKAATELANARQELMKANADRAKLQRTVGKDNMVPFFKGQPVIIREVGEEGVMMRVQTQRSLSRATKGGPTPRGKLVSPADVEWHPANAVTKKQFAGQARALGELEGLVKKSRKQLREMESRLRDAEARAARIDTRVRKAEEGMRHAESLRKQSLARAREARGRKVSAKKEVRKAEKTLKQTDPSQQKSMDEIADEIVGNILDRKKSPFGFIPEDALRASARSKARQLDWPQEMITNPDFERFLVTNPDEVTLSFTRDVAPRVALRRQMGSETLEDTLDQIDREFQQAIDRARNAGNKKLADALTQDRNEALKDLRAVRDRILGKYDMPDDPNSFLMWTNNEARKWNVLRLLGKVMMSSVTDVAVGKFNTNTNMQWFPGFMKGAVKQVQNIPDDELRAILVGFEQKTFFNRTARLYGLDDMSRLEKGAGQGQMRRITSAIEEKSEQATQIMNIANGMAWWNTNMRVAFGLPVLQNMRKQFANFRNLPKGTRQFWERRGINEDWADRISRQFEKHGQDMEGVQVPNGRAWDDSQAYERMEETLTRVLDSSIIVPGAGDTPLVMSKPLGKLLLQFQTFGFSATNKFLRPAVQRRDAFTAMIATEAMATAGIMYAARMALIGRLDRVQDQIEKTGEGHTGLVYEAFSRSPLVGGYALPMDVLMRTLARPANQAIGAEVFEQPSRLGERRTVTMALGPSFGLAEDAYGALRAFGDVATTGEGFSKLARKTQRLFPYGNLFWVEGALQAPDYEGFTFSPTFEFEE